jgi:hypothetical protein
MTGTPREVGMKIAEIGKQNVKLQTIAPENGSRCQPQARSIQHQTLRVRCRAACRHRRATSYVTAKDGGDGVDHKVAAIMSRRSTRAGRRRHRNGDAGRDNQRVRHLPVLRDGRLVNIIDRRSREGDARRAQEEIRHLRE